MGVRKGRDSIERGGGGGGGAFPKTRSASHLKVYYLLTIHVYSTLYILSLILLHTRMRVRILA